MTQTILTTMLRMGYLANVWEATRSLQTETLLINLLLLVLWTFEDHAPA